eukprot:m.344399 g.344399  ORF g.344399 m.344399 type:complete len:821 (+) comp24380_c0_seq1:20-2482(+)
MVCKASLEYVQSRCLLSFWKPFGVWNKKSAVLRFAGEHNLLWLKHFSIDMTPELGEEMLLRLQFTHRKTALANALEEAIEELQKLPEDRDVKDTKYIQMVLLITDGLSRQAEIIRNGKTALQEVIEKATCKGIAVTGLEINNEQDHKTTARLKNSFQGSTVSLKHVNAHQPSDAMKAITNMLVTQLQQKVHNLKQVAIKDIRLPKGAIRSCLDSDDSDEREELGSINWIRGCERSKTPFCNVAVSCFQPTRKWIRPFLDKYEIRSLVNQRHNSEAKEWKASENNFGLEWWKKCVGSYPNLVFAGTETFNANLKNKTSCRKKSGFPSGKSINPRQLGVCLLTKSTKFWDRMVKEGSPAYRFAVALDTSVSMGEDQALFSTEAFVLLAEIIDSFGVKDNILYTFGSDDLVLVKSSEQNLTADLKAQAIEWIAHRKFEDQNSHSGRAVMAGVDMLNDVNSNSVNYPSTLFVITDDGACSMKQASMDYAAYHGVNVVQIVMGNNATSPDARVFESYIEASSPYELVKGLDDYFGQIQHCTNIRNALAPMRAILSKNPLANQKAKEILESDSPFNDLLSSGGLHDEETKDIQMDLTDDSNLQVDLVIVMDCTQSMEPWIEQAKTHTKSIVDFAREEVKKSFSQEGDVQVGFVAYRDFDMPKEELYDSIGLTSEIDLVVRKIDAQQASGGDDMPEDPIGGLEIASKFEWRREAFKMIVLVADAPQHGEAFYDSQEGIVDKHPKCPPWGHEHFGIGHLKRAKDVLTKLKSKDVQLVFTHIHECTNVFEAKLKEIYEDDFKVIKLGDKPQEFATAVEQQLRVLLEEIG